MKQAGTAVAGACVLGIGATISACKQAAKLTATKEGNTVRVLLTDLAATKTGNGVVDHSSFPGPVFVSKNEQGNYEAVLMICTHKRCELRATSRLLICPCHGSEFSFDGEVLEPPAQKPLPSYKVTTKDEYLEIEIPG